MKNVTMTVETAKENKVAAFGLFLNKHIAVITSLVRCF